MERMKELSESLPAVGSFDNGDPTTTNLYVGNVSPQVVLQLDICLKELGCNSNQHTYPLLCAGQ